MRAGPCLRAGPAQEVTSAFPPSSSSSSSPPPPPSPPAARRRRRQEGGRERGSERCPQPAPAGPRRRSATTVRAGTAPGGAEPRCQPGGEPRRRPGGGGQRAAVAAGSGPGAGGVRELSPWGGGRLVLASFASPEPAAFATAAAPGHVLRSVRPGAMLGAVSARGVPPPGPAAGLNAGCRASGWEPCVHRWRLAARPAPRKCAESKLSVIGYETDGPSCGS